MSAPRWKVGDWILLAEDAWSEAWGELHPDTNPLPRCPPMRIQSVEGDDVVFLVEGHVGRLPGDIGIEPWYPREGDRVVVNPMPPDSRRKPPPGRVVRLDPNRPLCWVQHDGGVEGMWHTDDLEPEEPSHG